MYVRTLYIISKPKKSKIFVVVSYGVLCIKIDRVKGLI